MGCGASGGSAGETTAGELIIDGLPILAGAGKQTTTGEPIIDGLPFCIPKILMPRKDIDLTKWACVACDQFESEPQYWAEMENHVGDAPSSLRIVFPEVYLSSLTGAAPEEDTKRIQHIGTVMKRYLSDRKTMKRVFAERPPAFVALDRKTECVQSRKGLMVAVDLEQYNFNCPKPTLIRPTERTIVERLPPRIAIRQDAPLEMPHIIMIIDDPGKTVIEPLFTAAGLTEPEYECSLFKGAGSVKGFRVTDAGTEHVTKTMKALVAKEMDAAKTAGRDPAVILIGDGNHSLATAKSCWEALKTKGGVDTERHPARYALVELQNLHDDGVVFEPIHRVLEGAKPDDVQAYLEKAFGCTAIPFVDPAPRHSIVLVKGDGVGDRVVLEPPKDKLPVVSMSTHVDAFIKENAAVKIGFVHGVEPVVAACAGGKATGLLLPSLDKTRFLETIHDIGTLPRKAFSMGEANEKRFYIEARNILP